MILELIAVDLMECTDRHEPACCSCIVIRVGMPPSDLIFISYWKCEKKKTTQKGGGEQEMFCLQLVRFRDTTPLNLY